MWGLEQVEWSDQFILAVSAERAEFCKVKIYRDDNITQTHPTNLNMMSLLARIILVLLGEFNLVEMV